MNRTTWWTNRKAKTAAKNLQRGLMLVEATVDACTERQANVDLPSARIREAKSRIVAARRLIEEIESLSFNDQSRFFRQFERLQECLDYAAESIVYEEFGAAKTDLCRAGRAIQETTTHLHSQTGVKPHRAPFPRLAVALVDRISHDRRPEARESAEIIHLADARTRSDSGEPQGPSLMLL